MTLLKVRDVAERLRMSENTVRRWAQSGKLPAYRLGPHGDYRFDPDKIAEYLKDRKR